MRMSSGILYFLYAMLDSNFRNALKRKLEALKYLIGFKFHKIDKIVKNDPVNTFIHSSMNMEMVCSILNGIQLTLKDM
jgi:hypothetical protein